jgi:hypothetical protein
MFYDIESCLSISACFFRIDFSINHRRTYPRICGKQRSRICRGNKRVLGKATAHCIEAEKRAKKLSKKYRRNVKQLTDKLSE